MCGPSSISSHLFGSTEISSMTHLFPFPLLERIDQ
ncbi:hypothetical protein HID58_071130 [Brassica napus]|uniref:Uncharacterized protein n=1 Tax=Brassica napus TaxID=3708 RepID=A0ABQ7Z0R6_BRANA|nr:hypothetical protein HID58_071130 [Brassica napus]